MEKGYINPIGQRVVDVDCGYKVYDADRKDAIILRVGDDYNGQYVYIDRTPVLEKTADVCFMSTPVLMAYEKALKIISSTKEYLSEPRRTMQRRKTGFPDRKRRISRQTCFICIPQAAKIPLQTRSARSTTPSCA